MPTMVRRANMARPCDTRSKQMSISAMAGFRVEIEDNSSDRMALANVLCCIEDLRVVVRCDEVAVALPQDRR